MDAPSSSNMFQILVLLFVIETTTIVIEEPVVIEPNDTVSVLYQLIGQRVAASCEISIVFNGKIIPNLINESCIVTEIGMNETFNHIQIIQKPYSVMLLEMIHDIINKEQISWYKKAMHCISANRCENASDFGTGLRYDDNDNLIVIDLSHLNLTGNIILESLPQSVRALDLSFNDLNTLNLDGLRGKSLEKLNVQHNRRCHIDTESVHDLPLRKLQVSSNQIFPWIADLQQKEDQIKQWFWDRERRPLSSVIVDGVKVCSLKPMPLKTKMLEVIEGITNKERIPWFQAFVDNILIRDSQWIPFGIRYRKSRGVRSHSSFKFNLRGLGLKGHVNLGALPWNVVKLDLSDNNLSSVSFDGDGEYYLMDLNLQNNDNLRLDLMQIDPLSNARCLRNLSGLSVSWNQLDMNESVRIQRVREWLRASNLDEIVVDDYVMQRL